MENYACEQAIWFFDFFIAVIYRGLEIITGFSPSQNLKKTSREEKDQYRNTSSFISTIGYNIYPRT